MAYLRTAADGAAYCWGSNGFGQLGDGPDHSFCAAPVRNGPVSRAGGLYTCGTTEGASYR
jgi:alpha-tubulin suppressor-like RCC1 family protein